MKRILKLVAAIALLLSSYSFSFGQDLIITGVFDGPLTGGTPKGVELYVVNNIADLSIYGLGSANNGGGTDGEEFTFPNTTATAGDFIYVAFEGSNTDAFLNFFGFAPDYLSNVVNVNGDDAFELFQNGNVIDVFGDISGPNTNWNYQDGWAYRVGSTGPDGTTFNVNNWTFSGANQLEGGSTNATTNSPFPNETYSLSCTATLVAGMATCDANTSGTDTYTATFSFSIGSESGSFAVSSSAGTPSPNPISADGTITVTGINEGTNVTVTVTNSSNCDLMATVNSPSCLPIPDVCINEVNADQANDNAGGEEFVELTGPANESLDGLVIVFFNGNGDASYDAYDLDGFSTDANGFFTIGNIATATFGTADGFGAANAIQNGADAVALYLGDATDFPNGTAPTTTNLVSAVVYGTGDADDTGLLTALGQTTQWDEDRFEDSETQSILRRNDDCSVDNFYTGTPTPNAANGLGPVFVEFVEEAYSVAEGNAGTSTVMVEVTIEADPGESTTVQIADATTGTATSGADYAAVTGASRNLTFATGGTFPKTQSYTFTANGDTDVEGNETADLTFTITSGTVAMVGERDTTIVTILDDDAMVADVCINELRISSGSNDGTNNFVELKGAASTNLDGLWLLAISGEFNPGLVNNAIDLTGSSTDSDGFVLIANSSNPALAGNDVAVNGLDFFGSPVTFLVVENFSGSANTDLDTNDDGTFESTPWLSIVDGLSLIDGDTDADVNYSNTIEGPQTSDPDFPPAGVARDNDNCAVDSFTELAFDSDLLDTPGESNANTCTASITETTATCDATTPGTDTYDATFTFDIGSETGSFNVSASAGTLSSMTISGNGTITVSNITEGTDVTLTVDGNSNNPNCSIVATVNSPVCVETPDVCINEVDADQTGTDSAEFVELTGASGLSLNGLVLVFFNGSGDASYAAYDLDGQTIPGDGFFVVGNVPEADFVPTGFPATNAIQNGADAVALYLGDATDFPNGTAATTANLVSAIAYDTSDGDDTDLLTALGLTQQINENGNGAGTTESVQRENDDCSTEAFFVATPTPGATNGNSLSDCTGINAGDLVITEIMQNPSAAVANDTIGEYVEIYNATGSTIDLTELVLRDADNDSHLIPSGNSIAAGEYYILARTASLFDSLGVMPDYVYSDFILSNGSDEVILQCGSTIVDSVGYDDGATFPDPNGASMNLNPNFLNATANDSGANWCESTSTIGAMNLDLGTPGMANDACITETPTVRLNEILIDPPNSDNSHEFIELIGDASASLDGLHILILDGDAASPGDIDQAISLSNLSLGSNGLLLYSDATDKMFQPNEDPNTTVAGESGFSISNGSSTILIVSGFTGMEMDDLDTDNDGTLDATPWASVIDAVSYTDGNADDAQYAAALGGTQFPSGQDVDALFITSDNQTWVAVNEFDNSASNPGPYTYGGTNGVAILTDGSTTTTVSSTLSPGNVNTTLAAGCQVDATLSGTVTSGQNITTQVSNNITSTQTINSGATVVYDAGNIITLGVGFEASNGSTFTAMIGGCTPLAPEDEVEARSNEVVATEELTVAPNPFSGETTITYNLLEQTTVVVVVYDMTGAKVATLVEEKAQAAGEYQIQFDGANLNAGLYLVVVQTNDKVRTEKVSVLK